jgi:hypothetical protein
MRFNYVITKITLNPNFTKKRYYIDLPAKIFCSARKIRNLCGKLSEITFLAK